MEDLLTSTEYSQPLGIRCMELCIKDVNEATASALKKFPLDFSNAPSWKFPHISVDKLDSSSIIQIYQSRNLSDDQQYQELLELLIDRMYFSLLTAYQLLCSLQSSGESSGDIGQGDGSGNGTFVPVITWSDNLSRGGQDDETSQSYPNIGGVLQLLHSKVTALMDAKSKAKEGENVKQKSSPQKRHGGTQTTETSGESCETCFIAQNLLKFLADTVTNCHSALLNGTRSEIEEFRENLKSKVWYLTQRTVVGKWATAIENDCETVHQKTEEMLNENSKLKEELDTLKSTLEYQETKQNSRMEELQKTLTFLEKAKESESYLKKKFLKQAEGLETKSSSLESQLQTKTTECARLSTSVTELSESLQRMQNIHKELLSSHEKMEENIEQVQDDLGSVTDDRDALKRRLNGLEAQLEMKAEENMLLNEALEKYKSDAMKKEEMKGLLEKARTQLECCRKSEDDSKKGRIADQTEIQRLQKELEEQAERIELLTLYPDLNGPINPPQDDNRNPIMAMEKQVLSNKLRIDLLQGQTDKLSSTLVKLRSHMRINYNIG